MYSNMNQSTLNSSLISNNVQGNSPLNYSRTGQINNNNNNIKNIENRIPYKNLYIEEVKNAQGNVNYNSNTSGPLTNSNISNIINRKRNYNQMIGIENLTDLTSQNIKPIDVNEQNFKTPINAKNEQYEFQLKKFKYQA